MKVGFTCSCFDMFHAGHVLMLREAKQVCDHLIAGLQTDPTLDRPEKNKPVLSLTERHLLISSCRYVDEVILYETESDLLGLLSTLPIDVRIIGEEYRNREFTGKHLPIEIHYNKRGHDWSSTAVRKKVVDAHSENDS